MKREQIVWLVLFVFGGLCLVGKGLFSERGLGRVYVRPVPVNAELKTDDRIKWVNAKEKDETATFSWERTIGLWIAALLTLAIFSFLYRDNVFYKIAEAVFVGVTAAYVMAQAFWEGIVDRLLANLTPQLMRAWALPEIKETQQPNYLYLVPLALGIMLLWRLAPRGGWISRWPLAFIVGTFAGVKLISFLEADFVAQIRSTVVPLFIVSKSGGIDFWASLRNAGLIIGVLSCLTYFFFSVEHRGMVGKVARLGVWFLMVTFGASFAFTVMGRIALFAARVEFLFVEWLRLIAPPGT
jgi:hypothetical protein